MFLTLAWVLGVDVLALRGIASEVEDLTCSALVTARMARAKGPRSARWEAATMHSQQDDASASRPPAGRRWRYPVLLGLIPRVVARLGVDGEGLRGRGVLSLGDAAEQTGHEEGGERDGPATRTGAMQSHRSTPFGVSRPR